MQFQLNISGVHFEQLQKHLFPGDGKEAVAIALCGRLASKSNHRLLVHDVILIPHEECIREVDFVHWKTDRILPFLERASKGNMAILKIHSHPGGYEQFSSLDDNSDSELFSSVFGWIDGDFPHASVIMLPSGRIFGRVFFEDLSTKKIDQINVAGDTIYCWNYGSKVHLDLLVGMRTAQAFGEGTYEFLKKLKIGIIGCSGTGSPVIEQLVRLGVGKIVIVDPDAIELKNLNRILNSKRIDADEHRLKVDMIESIIHEIDLGTEVKAYSSNLYDNIECLRDLATCNILFGCVDSVDGRDLINRLATYYILPYFDLGIKLEANGKGNISKIVGTVNYVQPGKSSLMSRGLYDAEDLKSAGLFRIDPKGFPELVKNSYIKNIKVNRPAVISVNLMIASYAVNEFLNRIHNYKAEHPGEYAQSTIDLTENCFIHVAEKDLKEDEFLKSKIGLGDKKLFLGMVELSDLENEITKHT